MAFGDVMVEFVFLMIIAGVVTECTVLEADYQYIKYWKGKVCQSNDLLFSERARTITECLNYCTRSSHCTSIFYKKIESACFGCMFHTNDPHELSDTSGTVFYTKRLYEASTIPCGHPQPKEHVNYRHYFLREPSGYQTTYKCIPCTFFIPHGTTSYNKLYCQDDGTWTIPMCVSAATVGYLKHGNLVPDGNIGCADVFHGDTCSFNNTSTVQGIRYSQKSSIITGCYCYRSCCQNRDCCYDYYCK